MMCVRVRMCMWAQICLLALLALSTHTFALDNVDLANGVLCDVRMWGDFKTRSVKNVFGNYYVPRGVVSDPLNLTEIDTQVPLMISTVVPREAPIDYYAVVDSDQRGFHPLLTDPDVVPDYDLFCYSKGWFGVQVEEDCSEVASFTRFRGMIDFSDLSEGCATRLFHVFANPDDSGHLNLFRIDPSTRQVVQVPTLNDKFLQRASGRT
ncbi:MAG: hypothetical protein MHM6MM_008004, partial [Cercozoa sp. M6MM]